MENIEISAIYKHYKNNQLYKVLYLGKHTETNEDLVINEALYDDHKIWCRPANMWLELVEYNGKKIKRFTKIG